MEANISDATGTGDGIGVSSCQFLQWQTPLTEWVCLHTNGVVNAGYGRSIGFSDGLTAKLWAIHDSLELAWNNVFLNLQVRSDFPMAISLVMNPNAANSSHALVRAITTFGRRAWSLEFIWVPREINRPVDSLAKQVPPDQFDLFLFGQPPCCIHALLSTDVHGPPYYKARTS
ncbi:hypothetical protein V6N13_126502 [Hibiscus sabdariffa]